MKIAEENKLATLVVSVVALLAVGAGAGSYFCLPFLGGALGATLGVWLGEWISHEHIEVRPSTTDDLEALNAYTEGKMHRYTLLFAVNGGAYAVAQFLLQPAGSQYRPVLPIAYLAQGAIVFTALMTVDVWLFGQGMREKFVGDGAFTAPGKALLLMISLLLVAGWFMVLRHDMVVRG